MAKGDSPPTVLLESQVSQRMAAELPGWKCEAGLLVRRYRTGGWRPSMMVANTIAHLAEVAFHHPELTIAYREVTVRLVTHSAGGLTAKDFELARKIEEVVTWHPDRESSALEGVPDGPFYRYLEYD